MWRELAILFLLTLSLPGLALAEGPGRAGLVVQFDDERVETFCLDLEDGISGADLLARLDLDVVVEPSGMGTTVCQIAGQGCAFPVEHCFCNCMFGGDCAYWNYYYRDPGEEEWTYSALGAAQRQVEHGSVEAWVWGDGHSPPADDLTFAAICAPPTPTNTPASTNTPPASIPDVTPSPASVPIEMTATSLPSQSPTRLVGATVQLPHPTPSPVSTPAIDPSLSGYWPFALVLLGLVAIGAIVWLRRARIGE